MTPILALTALSAVPVVMLATWIYRRLSSPAYAQARLEIGKVNSTLQEKVSGMRVVQSHGQQQQEAARLRALSDNFRATRVRAQKIPCRLFSVPDLLAPRLPMPPCF
ncbi:ATP-binding protein [Salmonella enterica subsp. enterica]|uniref:ATP-binding protein n=1 Tax=Salmonella enterica I TaxID=59201 RepID=A0A447TX93_SALET|nr:ATP-binding protein [Salmonella enterica subsp. enterica]